MVGTGNATGLCSPAWSTARMPRRLRSGRYRVLYDVNDSTVTVVVIHAGRSAEG
ncbi:MAG: hypothetical protein L0Y54_11085 [Sporichthyaceae bacterium]|nr:hypothetical protein [Sporichthyaceae bacterium]